MIHAPHFDNGRALCGADFSLEFVAEATTCPACLELQMEAAREMAEFEGRFREYYEAVGDAIQAALCDRNAETYLARAEQIRAELQPAQAA